ncbi:methyl-accepting chemotaxis protein [Saccharospirillum mangrovi]|uniref:methyl-accepting chemotaxis protein n=1 Tax=Saccharospirillum mangrovi TaxID=2161747 RepID=UPI000D347E84|nr:methyl-accepting chemotaxis protein [Saccharospirillum mangrovi]
MKSLSIRARLMGSVALTVLVLVAINGAFNYLQARNNLSETVDDRIHRSGTAASRFVANWLVAKQAVLDGAADALETGGAILPVVAQGARSGDFLYMYLGTAAGRMLIQPETALPDDYDPRTRPWYSQAQARGGHILTPPYVDASSGDLVMSFARPAANGVLAADVALTEIVNEVLGVQLWESGYAAVIDGNGTFIVHPDETLLDTPLTELIGNTSLGESPKAITLNGEAWLGASYPIAGTQWRMALLAPRNEAFAELFNLARSNTVVSALTIIVVTLVCGVVISLLLKPLSQVNTAMSDIAQGEADLTRRLDVVRADEVGRLSQSFNHFIESIHDLVANSLDSAQQLAKMSESARDRAQANNEAIQLQQSEISQVAAAINEMSSTAAEVASNAADTATAAQQANEEGKKGSVGAGENRQRMGRLTEQIDTATGVIGQLNAQAQQINTILSTIQDIAEQTNLLALNAAIEAARAGDQGRGFAVVADEVRALSKRTHDATGEIQTMIEALQDQTQQAVDLMGTSKELTAATAESAQGVTASLDIVASSITDITQRAQTIAEASREQNTATEEISRIATAIQDASDRLASNVRQATSQSDQLHQLSDTIRQHLSRFRT